MLEVEGLPQVDAKAEASWTNRIVSTALVRADAFLANDRNWRIHPREQQEALTTAVEQVGLVAPVIVNKRTADAWGVDAGIETLVDGHLRVELALRRGDNTELPVVYVDLAPDEERLVLASLDPIGDLAVADKEKLAELLAGLDHEDAAVEALARAVAKECQVPMEASGVIVEDEVPEPPDDPTTKSGDLWLLGEHRVLCGDSTKAEDVARLMDGRQAVCMWTDPPYGVGYVGKTQDAKTIRNDDVAGLSALLRAALVNAAEVLEEGAPFYLAHPPGALLYVFEAAVERSVFRVHQCLVWVKDCMVLGHSDYHYRHEPILYGYKPGHGRSGRGDHEGSRWYGDHSQTSVLEFDRPQRSEEHPTMKPVGLVACCLRNSTPPHGIVLDLFGGSGSTLIAAEEIGRVAYLMEIDPRYCDVIVRRWENLTGRTAVLERQGS